MNESFGREDEQEFYLVKDPGLFKMLKDSN